VNLVRRARAALLPAILAVASSAIFVRWAVTPHPGSATPLATAFWRGAIAGIAFLPLFLIPRFRQELLALPIRRFGIIFAATTIICLHQICFITSLSYTSIAASTFLTSTQPIFTAFFGSFLLKEKVSFRSWLLIIGAIIGMGLITLDRHVEGALLGNSLAVAAAILAALYSLAARKLRQSTPLIPFMFSVHVSGTIFLGVLVWISGVSLTGFTTQTWSALLLLALLPTFLGHSLLTFSVGYLPAFVVSSSLLGEPVGATLLGMMIFQDYPGIQTIAGAVVIVACILGIVMSKRDIPEPEPMRE